MIDKRIWNFPIPNDGSGAEEGAVDSMFPAPGAAALSAQAQDTEVTSTIIEMERAALDRPDPGGFLEISDPDVVYMDPSLDRPIHGLDALTAFYAGFPVGNPAPPGEMRNSKVQVFGDTAILTFNYKREGKPTHGWNATEVYRRTEKGWRIVHTHWAYRKPVMP